MQTSSRHHQLTTTAEAANQSEAARIAQIDALLPQTQCRQCGYAGCKPYATAIARGEAEINQCPPGGEIGLRALADLLHRPYVPLNPAHGVTKAKLVAVIDETTCIGCTLCISACPVDAILGASKQMHTVIGQLCTGCELCLPPCPVDCIEMQVVDGRPMAMNAEESDLARQRHTQRLQRLALENDQKRQTNHTESSSKNKTKDIKKLAMAAAIARVHAQKA